MALPQLDWDSSINLMLRLMQSVQQGVLQVFSWLHLVQEVDGQPAWPFALRLSGEVMLMDRSVARALLTALAWLLLALALLTLAAFWRRARWLLVALAGVLLWCPSWPDAALLTATATPTSFQTSPRPFSTASILQGEKVYRQLCMGCHGTDGKGNSPLGLALPVAPPNLSSGLLWRRLDGDLYWSLRQGKGHMPGFAAGTSSAQRWALIDYMKANAAGVAARDTGSWPRPLPLPDLPMECGHSTARHVRQWQGQRIRLVVAGARLPAEDPRLQSVVLGDEAASSSAAQLPEVGRIDCHSNDASALRALAILSGVSEASLPGTELIADRDGWLRARSSSGAWSQSDMLCRAAPASADRQEGTSADQISGIDQLIAAMDAQPVRFIKGGFVH